MKEHDLLISKSRRETLMFDRNRTAERYEASKPNRAPGRLQVSNNLPLDFEEIFCDGKKIIHNRKPLQDCDFKRLITI